MLTFMGRFVSPKRGEERRAGEKNRRKGKIKPQWKSNFPSRCHCQMWQLDLSLVIVLDKNTSSPWHTLSVFIMSPLALAAFNVLTFMYVAGLIFPPSNRSQAPWVLCSFAWPHNAQQWPVPCIVTARLPESTRKIQTAYTCWGPSSYLSLSCVARFMKFRLESDKEKIPKTFVLYI